MTTAPAFLHTGRISGLPKTRLPEPAPRSGVETLERPGLELTRRELRADARRQTRADALQDMRATTRHLVLAASAAFAGLYAAIAVIG